MADFSMRARAYIRMHVAPILPVAAVFSAALLVRIVYNLTVARGYVPHFDAAIYDGLAMTLLRTHCYCYAPGHPTVFRPPLWPFVIAATYAMVGVSTLVVRLVCAVLGSGTCALVYLYARDLFGRRVALVVGVLAAIYAGMFIWDGWLFSESLFIFLQTAFLLALLRMQRTGQAAWAIIGGVLLGLSALARPNGALLLGLLALWVVGLLVFRLLPWRLIAARVALMALVALAITLPWTWRNYTVTGSLVPVSTVGTTLAGAYNNMVDQPSSGLYGLWWLAPRYNGDIHPHNAADEQALLLRALAWVRANPNETRALLAVHFEHMWVPYVYSWTDLPFEEFPTRPSSQLVRQLIPLMSLPIFLMAGLGLLLTWRQRGADLLAVYLLIALTVVENVVFYGSPRFRAPIEPFLVVLAGGTLWWLGGMARRGARRLALCVPLLGPSSRSGGPDLQSPPLVASPSGEETRG